MVVQVRHCQVSQRLLYKPFREATSITLCQTLDSPEADSGPNMDVIPTDRIAQSETRCSTGPTPPEVAPQEDVHPLSTVYSRPHGDADPALLATPPTQLPGSIPLRSMDGLSLTSLHLLEIHLNATVSDLTADLRELTPLHST